MSTKNKAMLFNFNNTYLCLPKIFYRKVNPALVPNPKQLLLNQNLIKQLGIVINEPDNWIKILSGNEIPDGATPIAQAYAGHQFGNFNMLGDGRAILLGEHLSLNGNSFDIQLKGSGQTPYSRRGDGKATLRAMLREYLISEAMFYLGIPTSRSLAVITTGEPVFREVINQGAVLTRIMKSHIRVGTFEFASAYGTKEDLQIFTNYTIKRHFPELATQDNPPLKLLEKVMNHQIELVVHWMRVGFIHGVMNTDNTAICSETFDYGPCAFMNSYSPYTVFSAIDSTGRYAFGNQPKIIKWNIAQLAESLLPIIATDAEDSVALVVKILNKFDVIWNEKYYTMMLNKLGIEHQKIADSLLVDELLLWMQFNKADYTNTFNSLMLEIDFVDSPISNPTFEGWFNKWQLRISENKGGLKKAKQIMKKHNPVFIPRNHWVEQALLNAENADLGLFNELLELLKNPYTYKEQFKSYFIAPNIEFDDKYQTFCGT